ncbi:hypothetical protein RBH35_26035, partial [Escherichia coli]|uniref:hypothetical protein n=1 Tax=Escherichia coli TaxID=562 RepID=UPI002FC96E4D
MAIFNPTFVAYSIYTRIASEITHPKCAFFERFRAQKKQHSETTYPTKRSRFSHRFSEQQNRFAGGWPHCVTPTTTPSVFIRHVVN